MGLSLSVGVQRSKASKRLPYPKPCPTAAQALDLAGRTHIDDEIMGELKALHAALSVAILPEPKTRTYWILF